MSTAPMTLLCAYLGYAAGMGFGRFVVGCQEMAGVAKPTPPMQYGISAGDLVLQSSACLPGTTGSGDVDTWDLNSGSCTGAPPRQLVYIWKPSPKASHHHHMLHANTQPYCSMPGIVARVK